MANNPTTGTNQGTLKFRCKDVGFASCPFEATGRNEQDLMPQIERHGRDAHGLNEIDQQTRNKVKNAIRPAA
jgi:predicted small metal-binding protein